MPKPSSGDAGAADASPTALVESQLSPTGEPVIGLYLHVAYTRVMASFDAKVGQGGVTPAVIGVISLVAAHPGISQAELARLIGLERATVGSTVSRAVRAGLVLRTDAAGDARRYALTLTARGRQRLRSLKRRIAVHEAFVAGHLTDRERRQLRDLLPHSADSTASAAWLAARIPGSDRPARSRNVSSMPSPVSRFAVVVPRSPGKTNRHHTIISWSRW